MPKKNFSQVFFACCLLHPEGTLTVHIHQALDKKITKKSHNCRNIKIFPDFFTWWWKDHLPGNPASFTWNSLWLVPVPQPKPKYLPQKRRKKTNHYFSIHSFASKQDDDKRMFSSQLAIDSEFTHRAFANSCAMKNQKKARSERRTPCCAIGN
jgi:hypothetical protein